jgi:hypothetical protein
MDRPVGTLSYNAMLKADFEDRVLAHLNIVITAKLRRDESFSFTWKDATSIGDGRTIIWLHPTMPLVFKFFGSKMPLVNPLWIEVLMESANSSRGLQIVPEPAAEIPTSTAGLAA